MMQPSPANAEARSVHRGIFTVALQRMLEEPGPAGDLVRRLLDALQGFSPCAEEQGDGVSIRAISPEYRDYESCGQGFRPLWAEMDYNDSLERNDPRVDDILEIIGNEAYVTDQYEDWVLDPDAFWFDDDLEADYGISGDSYAGLGHFCPGGCSPEEGYFAGHSCWFLLDRSWDVPRARPLMMPRPGLGSAWDGRGERSIHVHRFGGAAIDRYVCEMREWGDVVLVRTDALPGRSRGVDYVTDVSGELEAELGLRLGGSSSSGDTGYDEDDTRFPPVEYMGRLFLRRWYDSGAVRHLGPVMHGVADAQQPMHVAGTLGNFHSWWESALAPRMESGTLERHQGRSPTCRTTYATPSDPTASQASECIVAWARDLAHEARRLAADPTAIHSRHRPDDPPIVREYYGLLYALAAEVRKEDALGRDEPTRIREWIDEELVDFYDGDPYEYCADIWNRGRFPLVHLPHLEPPPPDAVWTMLEVTYGYDSRRLECRGEWRWDVPATLPGTPWGPECVMGPTAHHCSRPMRAALFDGNGYRECRGEASDPPECPDVADASVVARAELDAQLDEQIDRAVAASLALLYLIVTSMPGTGDGDGDLYPDDLDNCPDLFTHAPEGDADGDGIGDRCDLCPNRARTDGGPVRASRQHNPAVGSVSIHDSDGDGIGDDCDLCPFDRRSWSGSYFQEDLDWVYANEARRRLYDHDGDGIGDRCDNCRKMPNRDQANCNADDEARAAGALPVLGDACDPMPCIDRCMVPITGLYAPDPTLDIARIPIFESVFFRGYVTTEPLTARFCAAGGDIRSIDAGTGVPDSANIRTQVRGCLCRGPERAYCRDGFGPCPQGGQPGGRWARARYRADSIVGPDPTYEFTPLYDNDPGAGGLDGRRYALEGYLAWYRHAAPDRIRSQPWNWISDLTDYGRSPPICSDPVSVDGRDVCRIEDGDTIGMWFKTLPPDEYRRPAAFDYGNTYTGLVAAPGVQVDPAEGEVGRIPAGTGQALLPHGRQMDLGGTFASPLQWIADLIWSHLCRTALDCPWPGWLFFDERGPRVGGLVVASWDPQRRGFANVVGTKLAPNTTFDVISPSVAMSFDGNGLPSRYWLFGGTDGSNAVTARMWSGVRRDGPGGISKSAENDLAVALGIEPPRLDGSESRFELSAVPEGEPWPAARRGAVLVCTGFGLSGGKPCDNLCPKGSDVEIPPGGRDDGALLLVGGEGEGGPLDDVWIYRGAGGAVRDGEGSGWRLAGHLPGIAGGLTEPGTVQLGRTLWLVGGRTAVGPSADVWRVDVDSGEAERLVTTGAALPSGRVSPAVTYDPIGRRILVFGGTDASGAGRTDLWALDPETSSWAQLAPACSGYGCPAVTGRELLVLDPVSGDVTVVADRGAETGSWVAWTLRGGVWKTRDETIAEATGLDCDEDGASEAMAGLPCDTGSGGFPDRGTLLCGGSDLVCRPPAAAGRLVVEYAMPMLRAGVGRGLEFFAARGRWVEVYRVGSDGHLSLDRSYVLRHPANDLAIAGSLLLAADARGLVVMDRDSGRRLSAVDTCGVARRVFAAGRATAIVVGLRRVTVVGLEDPSSPVVRADVELAPDWSRLTVRPGGRCPRGIEALERFWEALSPCGGGGRDVAAYGDGLLFLNLLGTTYVLELGREGGPAVVGRVATGMIKDTRYHDGRLFANTLWGSGVVVGPDGSESWRQEGTHEMNRWVQGTADVGGYSIWWGPGRLQVGTRQ